MKKQKKGSPLCFSSHLTPVSYPHSPKVSVTTKNNLNPLPVWNKIMHSLKIPSMILCMQENRFI